MMQGSYAAIKVTLDVYNITESVHEHWDIIDSSQVPFNCFRILNKILSWPFELVHLSHALEIADSGLVMV